jgi:hypothetical protein
MRAPDGGCHNTVADHGRGAREAGCGRQHGGGGRGAPPAAAVVAAAAAACPKRAGNAPVGCVGAKLVAPAARHFTTVHMLTRSASVCAPKLPAPLPLRRRSLASLCTAHACVGLRRSRLSQQYFRGASFTQFISALMRKCIQVCSVNAESTVIPLTLPSLLLGGLLRLLPGSLR